MSNILGNYARWRGLVALAHRFAGISCLWLPTCVKEMGLDRKVQNILVSNERGDAKSQLISHWINGVDFPNLRGGCNLVRDLKG